MSVRNKLDEIQFTVARNEELKWQASATLYGCLLALGIQPLNDRGAYGWPFRTLDNCEI